MKVLEFNDHNLSDDMIDIFKEKSRALIIDSNDVGIICEYQGVFLLPGGKKEKDETDIECLKRELKEELGMNFNDKEIVPFIRTVDYQKDYPTTDGKLVNRKVITNFYIINSNLKVNNERINPTKQEEGNLFYYYVDFNNIYNILSYPSNNPRREFFNKEISRVIREYKDTKNIDLHTHTNNSDGELTKEELISEAKEKNIGVLAISDHDSISAFSKEGLENFDDLLLVPGVEISCDIEYGTLHVLGYDFDVNNKDLNDFLELVRNNHIYNMKINNAGLKQIFGFCLSDETINNLIENDKIGRVFIAKELIKQGYVNTVQEAFDLYLEEANDALKSEMKHITWQEAFKKIKLADGLVVLAHPISLKKNKEELDKLVGEMKEAGLDGIETYNQIYDSTSISEYQNLAHKYDLYQTIGSDFHGKGVKPNVKLGSGAFNNKKIKKLNFVEEIKKRHNI